MESCWTVQSIIANTILAFGRTTFFGFFMSIQSAFNALVLFLILRTWVAVNSRLVTEHGYCADSRQATKPFLLDSTVHSGCARLKYTQ